MDLTVAASWNQVRQGVQVGPCPVTLSRGRGHTRSRRFQTRHLFHIEGKCSELEDEGERGREGLESTLWAGAPWSVCSTTQGTELLQ